MSEPVGFDPNQVAADADVSVEQLLEWVDRGFVPRSPDGSLGPDAVVRARLLRFATRRGLDEAGLATAVEREGDVLARYIRFLDHPEGPGRTLEEAAEQVGLPADEVRRLWVASGFGEETRLFGPDLLALAGLRAAREAGLPDEALRQLTRVFGDALGRVADLEVRLFHFYVHEQLVASGRDEQAVSEATTQIGEQLMALVEPAILYYHRKAWERSLRDDVLLHLVQDVEAAGGTVGELMVAVLFIDLANYTGLTEAMGDTVAAEVLDRFSDFVRLAASQHDGRVVKQIGDEFMVVFPSGEEAVRCGLDVAAQAAAEHGFPELRMGAHVGTALYRQGDYLGTTVNVAARAASEAGRGEFVVTSEMHDAAGEVHEAVWSSVGPRPLKGIREPVHLWTVSRPRHDDPDRPVDPVCGMALDPAFSGEFTATWAGEELSFCSSRCYTLFLADPDAYVGSNLPDD